jgi:hypothetical protein
VRSTDGVMDTLERGSTVNGRPSTYRSARWRMAASPALTASQPQITPKT